jgi:hypothetical protein
LCLPAFACSVSSFEAKASNSARLARRPRLEERGDLPLVVRRARPVAVTGRVDDGDVAAAAAHQELCPARHRGMLLVVAAAV